MGASHGKGARGEGGVASPAPDDRRGGGGGRRIDPKSASRGKSGRGRDPAESALPDQCTVGIFAI